MENFLQVISPKETLSSKIIQAQQFGKLASEKLRQDGRHVYETRKLKYNESAISNRPYSVAVQKGNSSIVTAVSLEVAKIRSNEKPGHSGGYFIPNVEIHSNACPLIKPGSKPLASTQFLNSTLAHILNNDNLTTLFQKDCLRIKDAENIYCFVCYVDIAVLCDDGSLLDLILFSIAKIFSRQVEIPLMKFDRNSGQLFSTNKTSVLKVDKCKLPVSLTFCIFTPEGVAGNFSSNTLTNKCGQKVITSSSNLFVDPTFDEVILSDSNTLIVVGTVTGELLSVEQLGSGLTEELQFEGIDVGKRYFLELYDVLK